MKQEPDMRVISRTQMANPFFRIKRDAQEDHALYGGDIRQLIQLEKSQDPRVVHYCSILRYHKKRCPICSWPRAYPFFRYLFRGLRKFFMRKVF